jgi:ferrous-iron efflux pump FieF
MSRPIDPDRAARLMRSATYASVALAAILIGTKLVAWVLTDSVSLLSSMMDSLMDIAASLINLFAVRHALTPADREHRFGHGKAEPLASLGQAAFIMGSGVFIVIQAVQRILHPVAVERTEVGIGVMVFAIVATTALVAYQRYVVKRTGSSAIKADSLHYVTDVLVNGSVIVSLLLVAHLGWVYADPIFAIGIALYILHSAWRIAREALRHLMDRELPDEERERIKAIVGAHPKVVSMHELKTRRSGVRAFIQLHMELDGAMPLASAHDVSDEVEAAILEAFPNAEVIIHADPEGLMEAHPTYPAH